MNIFESLQTVVLNGFSGKLVTDQSNMHSLFFNGELVPIKKHDTEAFIDNSSYNYGGKSIVSDEVKIYSRNFCVKSDGETKTVTKYGFINKDGYAFTPAIFFKVSTFSNGTASVQLNSNSHLYGVIDINGNPVVNGHHLTFCSFAQSNFFNFGKCFKDGKWGIVNKYGYNVIPCEYDWVRLTSPRTKHYYNDGSPTDTLYLSRNLIWFTAFIQGCSICNIVKGLFEVVSRVECKGILVLAQYEDSDSLNLIGHCLCNSGGENIIDKSYCKIEVLSNKYFACFNGCTWDIYFINENLKAELLFNNIESYQFGQAKRSDELIYYIVVYFKQGGVSLFELDNEQHYEIKYLENGKIYFDCPNWDFDNDAMGTNDVFALKYPEYTEIINLSGETISTKPISNEFEIITTAYGDGLIGYRQTEYPYEKGFIDMNGNIVIKPKYSNLHAFKNGTALVYTTYYGFTIDKTGKVIHSFSRHHDDDSYDDNETWKDQLGDAFDGCPDAYWNID